MAIICLVTVVPTTTYAADQPMVHMTDLTMRVGDQIKIRVNNMTKKATWTVKDKRNVKIDTSDVKQIKITAQKAGKVVVSAKCEEFVLKYEIMIIKHPFQKKTLSAYIDAGRTDGIGEVHWSQIRGAQGYCIYRVDGDKLIKIKTIKSSKVNRAECKPLNEIYYHFRARGYIVRNGVTIYSKYSTDNSIDE